MSNYRRDSYSDRDIDDYSDYQPGNHRRNNRGQPPVYQDDRPDHGADIRNRRREHRARQPTMEENLVSLALLNARNERDRTRVNLINRGHRPFHPVRRGTRSGARRHGHGGPPHIPPRSDEPGPAPNAGVRRAFPQAMNPNRRGPINDRFQAHRAGLAANADDPLNGATDRLEYRLDTVHLVIDEVIASATELRGQCLRASVRVGEEEARVLEYMARVAATTTRTAAAAAEAATTTLTTSSSASTFEDPSPGPSAEELLVRIRLLMDEANLLLPVEAGDRPSLSARFIELRELLRFYDRFLTRVLSTPAANPNSRIVPGPKGRAPMMAYDAVNEMEELMARLSNLQIESTLTPDQVSPNRSKSVLSTTMPEQPTSSSPKSELGPSTSKCPIKPPSRSSRSVSSLRRISSLSLKVKRSCYDCSIPRRLHRRLRLSTSVSYTKTLHKAHAVHRHHNPPCAVAYEQNLDIWRERFAELAALEEEYLGSNIVESFVSHSNVHVGPTLEPAQLDDLASEPHISHNNAIPDMSFSSGSDDNPILRPVSSPLIAPSFPDPQQSTGPIQPEVWHELPTGQVYKTVSGAGQKIRPCDQAFESRQCEEKEQGKEPWEASGKTPSTE
ncbi:hypothetical protein BDV93DRAFT_564904 [Ceratobasidium sp. AG-I]|nr:hypothetical protein BDV93DRAFT_564904 [Ceratobasidium sp. AG-I]